MAKYGKRVDLEEGKTMILVRQRANMPVPRIYALYRHGGPTFIVVERIQGYCKEQPIG